MIDVVEPSQFVQGSLLAGMGVGEKGVVVDREQRRTVDVLVGEGVWGVVCAGIGGLVVNGDEQLFQREATANAC